MALNAVIIDYIDQHLFASRSLQTCFTSINLLYYWFYANKPVYHLSGLYQHDKYGVVLNYVWPRL